jgi:hypothetical protein
MKLYHYSDQEYFVPNGIYYTKFEIEFGCCYRIYKADGSYLYAKIDDFNTNAKELTEEESQEWKAKYL